MAQERPVAATDYDSLETLSKNAVKEKQRFERLVMSKEDLLKMFEVRTLIYLNNHTDPRCSTTSTSCTLSTPRCLMAQKPLYTVAGP